MRSRAPGERRLSVRGTAAHLALLVAVPLLVFANTLGNAYHLDDFPRIVQNPEVERVWPPWRHFVDPNTMSVLPLVVQYRPM